MILVGMPALLVTIAIGIFDGATTLEEQLSREGAPALARAAVSQGDARRGAVVFLSTTPLVRFMSCQGRAR